MQSPSLVYSALVWRHGHLFDPSVSVGVSQPVGRDLEGHLSLD